MLRAVWEYSNRKSCSLLGFWPFLLDFFLVVFWSELALVVEFWVRYVVFGCVAVGPWVRFEICHHVAGSASGELVASRPFSLAPACSRAGPPAPTAATGLGRLALAALR